MTGHKQPGPIDLGLAPRNRPHRLIFMSNRPAPAVTLDRTERFLVGLFLRRLVTYYACTRREQQPQ